MLPSVNIAELRSKVRNVYEQVAQKPDGAFHFETGRGLAEKLGYDAQDLDRIPHEAVASFAGVGYHFGLASLPEGDTRTIADRIGHTDPAFTIRRYAHIFEEQRRAAAIPLLELLSPRQEKPN